MHSNNIPPRNRIFFILSAPSGCGKTTLSSILLNSTDDLKRSISHTTRPRRHNEVDGEDYHFLNRRAFEDMIANGEFIEWAEVHGNLYGTSFRNITDEKTKDSDLLFIIDVQGALQFKKQFENGVYIFILPPSIEELKVRLIKRGVQDENEIIKRIEIAKKEISYITNYNYIIINDDLKTASSKLLSIIMAERCSKSCNSYFTTHIASIFK